MSTFYVTTGEKAKVEFMDAGWTRASERGPVPCFSAEPARRGPGNGWWIFQKGQIRHEAVHRNQAH